MTEPGRQLWRNNFHPPIFSWNHTCPMVKSWYQSRNATPGPLGVPGGAKKGSDPSKGKNPIISYIFGEKKFLSQVGSFGTIIQSPSASKNWKLTLFWSKNGPKTAKNQLTFKWQKKFVSQWIFYFIAKINYFKPLLLPQFLKTRHFVIQGWGNLKTLGCAHPFPAIMKQKSCKITLRGDRTHSHIKQQKMFPLPYQCSHQDHLVN